MLVVLYQESEVVEVIDFKKKLNSACETKRQCSRYSSSSLPDLALPCIIITIFKLKTWITKKNIGDLQEVEPATDIIFDDESSSEEDVVEEHLDSDTCSEEDGNESEDEQPPRNTRVLSFIANDGTVWKKDYRKSQ